MSGEGKKKKDRDPIFSVCFVVFIVACVGVLGTYVDQEFFETDDSVIAYGDTVEVNYTGSYYAYYDEDGAVIFDTTLSNVSDSDSYLKANEFSGGSEDPIEVTVGDGDYLALFESCLVGHQVGDRIEIVIPLGDGYVAPEGSMHSGVSTTLTVPQVQTMTETQFSDLYDVDLDAGVLYNFTSAYGWPAVAYYDVASNQVVIFNMPVAGETYEYTGNEDSDFGQVSFGVVSVEEGGDITVTMTIEDYTEVDDGIQMIALNVDGTTIYITDYDEASGTYSYKTCDENCNIVLYFVIEVVSIE